MSLGTSFERLPPIQHCVCSVWRLSIIDDPREENQKLGRSPFRGQGVRVLFGSHCFVFKFVMLVTTMAMTMTMIDCNELEFQGPTFQVRLVPQLTRAEQSKPDFDDYADCGDHTR